MDKILNKESIVVSNPQNTGKSLIYRLLSFVLPDLIIVITNNSSSYKEKIANLKNSIFFIYILLYLFICNNFNEYHFNSFLNLLCKKKKSCTMGSIKFFINSRLEIKSIRSCG